MPKVTVTYGEKNPGSENFSSRTFAVTIENEVADLKNVDKVVDGLKTFAKQKVLEEFGSPSQKQEQEPKLKPVIKFAHSPKNNTGDITEGQKKYLGMLLRRHGRNDDLKRLNVGDIGKSEATKLIDELKEK